MHWLGAWVEGGRAVTFIWVNCNSFCTSAVAVIKKFPIKDEPLRAGSVFKALTAGLLHRNHKGPEHSGEHLGREPGHKKWHVASWWSQLSTKDYPAAATIQHPAIDSPDNPHSSKIGWWFVRSKRTWKSWLKFQRRRGTKWWRSDPDWNKGVEQNPQEEQHCQAKADWDQAGAENFEK